MASVAIWGSYLWGNFGDDLMGIMTAMHLKSSGHDPVIYKLDKTLANLYQVRTAPNLEELLDDAGAIVIGGGGLLCSDSLMDDEWLQLEAALDAKQIPIHILSIGGDGVEADPHVSSSACRLIGSHLVKSASVRLASDIEAIKRLNPGLSMLQKFADVVFTAPRFFSPSKELIKEKQNSVIINLGNNHSLSLIERCFHLSPAGRGRKLVFAATHLAHLRKTIDYPKLDYEYQSQKPQKNLEYTDISTIIDALAKASVVISSKLHLGVTALAYGTPFISLNGAPKTLAFMRESGLDKYSATISGRFYAPKLCTEVLLGNLINNASNSEQIQKHITTLQAQSLGHCEVLDHFLNSL